MFVWVKGFEGRNEALIDKLKIMEVVLDYFGKVDLKHKIVQQYVESLKLKLEINQSPLADKEWASEKSEFHLQCRADLKAEADQIKRQIKLLE